MSQELQELYHDTDSSGVLHIVFPRILIQS